MDLISKKVNLFGVPGFEVIGYEDWARQCRHELETGLLQRVSYRGLKVQVRAPARIMLKTVETVEGSDATVRTLGVEMVIEKEGDGKWRLTQERILSHDEMAHDGLVPG